MKSHNALKNFFQTVMILFVITALVLPVTNVFADGFADEQKIEPWNTDTVNFGLTAFAQADRFGSAIAAEGNYMLAGAPSFDNGTTNWGLVAAYQYNGSQWLKKQEILGHNQSDTFGTAIAMDGAVAVIGAPGYNKPAPSGISDAGAAYVYLRISGTWTYIARLRASDWAVSDSLGTAVAISGQTIVVGAYEDDDGIDDDGSIAQEDEGSAYVFTPPAPYTTWSAWWTATAVPTEFTEVAKLTSPVVGSRVHYYFGRSVAISSNTIAIGEAGQAGANTEIPGSVYVFVRPGTAWVSTNTPTATLTSSDVINDERFGWTLSFASNKIYVGTPYHDTNGATAGAAQGAVFVYNKPVGAWANDSSADYKLTSPSPNANDFFGDVISVSNGTTPYLAVSETAGDKTNPVPPPATIQTGVVHVFQFDGVSTWNYNQMLEPSDGTANDNFGYGLDVNDTSGHVIVGSEENNDPTLPDSTAVYDNVGAVYTFKYDTVSPRVTAVYENAFPGTTITEGLYTNDSITSIVVRFTESMKATGGGTDDVTVPTNYSLVGTGGPISIDSIIYAEDYTTNPAAPRFYATLSVNNGFQLPDDFYTLTANGTLQDKALNSLCGLQTGPYTTCNNDVDEGTDFVRTFTVDTDPASVDEVQSNYAAGNICGGTIGGDATQLFVSFDEDMKSSNTSNTNNVNYYNAGATNYTLVGNLSGTIVVDAVSDDDTNPFDVTLDINGGLPLPVESYTLTVNKRVHDLAGNPMPVNFVCAFDVTNNGPTITSDGGGTTAALSVAENQTAVTTVTATDPNDLPATLIYSITGGADQLLFGIDSGTGVLTFNTAPDFETPGDADTNNVYEVTVTVTDPGLLTDNQAISVTVTDVNEAPTDIALDNNTVDENLAAGALVGNLTTTDPDPADTHTYSLACTVPGADDASFQISGSQLQTNAVFDYETDNSYTVCIRTTDSGTGNLTYDETFTINVNDVNEAPTDIALDNNTVDENLAAGALVGNLTTTDPDPADTHTYSLACTVPGADDASFQISGSQLQTNAVFDYETDNSYTVCIRTTDSGTGNLTYDETFTINVNDVNEAPTDIALDNNTVDENLAAGALVGNLTTTDPDPADTHTYSLACTVPGADDASFQISGSQLQTNAVFDYETDNSYTVCIRTTDSGTGNLTYDETFTINVNDFNEAPIITSDGGGATAAINHAENGTAVTTVTATDADLPAQTLTYSITGGADQLLFTINLTTGELDFLAAPDFETPADADTNNVYEVTVTVTDNGAPNLTDSQDISITITDLDEIRPTVTVEQGAAGPQADPTNTLPIVFDVVFSEDVSGFDATDLTLGGTAVPTAATVTMIDFAHYTVNVTAVTNNGIVTVSIDADKAHDAALNGNDPSTSVNNEVTYDTDAPDVTKIDSVNPTADNEITEGESTNVSITQMLVYFNEDVDQTLAEDAANYELLKDTLPYAITSITYDDNSDAGPFVATLNVAALPDGVYMLTVKAPIEDIAGTPMTADFVRNFTINTVTPNIVKIDSAATTADNAITQNEITNVQIKKLLVVFDKDMNETQAEDLANYALLKDGSAYTINSATYDAGTFTVTLDVAAPVAPKHLLTGDYQLTVKAGIEDISGNPLLADFVRKFEVDLLAPFVLNKGVDTNQSTEGGFLMDGEVTDAKIFLIKIRFSEEVYNPAGSTEDDDVTNVDNYTLLRNNKEKIKINRATYNPNGAYPKTVFLEINDGLPLPNGTYTLIVSGTNTIIDLSGTPLAGDGSTIGTDFTLDFTVFREKLPNTGFAPNMTTLLPEQSADLAYSALGDLWVEVPSLGIKSAIVGVPVSDKGWDTTWLWDQVGYLQGTAYPTHAGNTVITGHVTTADGKTGPFAFLKNLKYGDQVIVHFGGMKYIYEVRTTSLISPLNRTWLTRAETYSWLTMITCQSFDEKTGEYRYRRVVRAVLVNVEAEK